MSTHISECIEATTTMNKDDFDTVLANIKTAASLPKWKRYGWKDTVLEAKTFNDVMKEFNIGLVDMGNGNYRSVFNHVYVSDFFKDLLNIVTPYMTDGEIIVDDSYTITTITFNNNHMTMKHDDYNVDK